MNYPSLPALGRTDTSADAAPTGPQARTLQAAVVRTLRAGPATADEVAALLRQSILAIRPRFTELRATNRIYDTGIRRKNASGRNAIVWSLFAEISTYHAI